MASALFLTIAAALTAPNGTIVATIDGQSIFAAEVEAELRQAYGDRELVREERQRLFRAALEQIIDRHLVLAYLAKNGEAASKNDVALSLAQFEKELTSQNLSLKQHCEKVGLSPDAVRRALAWKLSWKRYCEKHLTPHNLEKYFDRHRREFDGTELRAAQILLKTSGDQDIDAVKEQAAKLRQEITSGKISFADAARRDSAAPSRETGGDIGWIQRQRPMPEDFSRLAYSLKKDEVGQPLVSPFGVHLITILDQKPGMKTWRDVEDELRPAMVLYLFRWIADKERAIARIDYTTKAE